MQLQFTELGAGESEAMPAMAPFAMRNEGLVYNRGTTRGSGVLESGPSGPSAPSAPSASSASPRLPGIQAPHAPHATHAPHAPHAPSGAPRPAVATPPAREEPRATHGAREPERAQERTARRGRA
jgi:hypothetical protein